jgi:hypothetical protein
VVGLVGLVVAVLSAVSRPCGTASTALVAVVVPIECGPGWSGRRRRPVGRPPWLAWAQPTGARAWSWRLAAGGRDPERPRRRAGGGGGVRGDGRRVGSMAAATTAPGCTSSGRGGVGPADDALRGRAAHPGPRGPAGRAKRDCAPTSPLRTSSMGCEVLGWGAQSGSAGSWVSTLARRGSGAFDQSARCWPGKMRLRVLQRRVRVRSAWQPPATCRRGDGGERVAALDDVAADGDAPWGHRRPGRRAPQAAAWGQRGCCAG